MVFYCCVDQGIDIVAMIWFVWESNVCSIETKFSVFSFRYRFMKSKESCFCCNYCLVFGLRTD